MHDYFLCNLFLCKDEKVRTLYKEAMTRGFIEAALAILIFVGVTGSGKSLFKRLVLGQDVPEFSPSTPLAESAVRTMSVCQVEVDVDDECKWEIVKPKKMMDIVAMKTLNDSPHIEQSKKQQRIKLPQKKFESLDQRRTYTPGLDPLSSTKKIQPEPIQAEGSKKTSFSTAFTVALSKANLDQHLMKKIESGTGVRKLKDVKFVYIFDSGGQPPFRDMLSHFVQQSSGIVLFQKLNERLDFKPTIKYREEGVEEEGCGYQLTNEQILHQYFQAVQSHDSKIFVVGTHKDLEHECTTETRADKNQRLFEGFRPVVAEHMVLYKTGNPDQLIFPVDNTSRDPKEQKTAEEFRKAVVHHCMGQNVKIPAPWFMLEQLLQCLAENMDTNVLNIDECYEAAAQKLHIDHDGCRAALEYLSKLNIIFYRPDILHNVVFCSAQVILSKLTELARCSHRMRTNSDMNIPQGLKSTEGVTFRDSAIVDADLLKEFPSHYRPGLFEPTDFLRLMENLLIAGHLKNGKHFIPSLLPDLPPEKVTEYRVTSSDHPAPMTIHYPKSMLPVGVVPALVVYLQNYYKLSPLSRGGKPVCMYRNCMQFQLPEEKAGSLTLIDSTQFLEIHVETEFNIAENMCPKLKEMLTSGLREAHKSLHYKPPAAEFGLICSGVCGNKEAHLATLDQKMESWRCSENQKKGNNLSENQHLWFAKGQSY